MAKKKYAEVKESLPSLKEEAKQAKKDLKNYCKSQKLDPEAEHPDNKKWAKLKAVVTKTSDAVTAAETWLSENKEQKEKAPRKTVYDYPPEIQTASEKKKYRAQQRAANKKKEKEANGEAKSSKKDKKKEAAAPEKTEKVSKKDKKKNKEKAAETTSED